MGIAAGGIRKRHDGSLDGDKLELRFLCECLGMVVWTWRRVVLCENLL